MKQILLNNAYLSSLVMSTPCAPWEGGEAKLVLINGPKLFRISLSMLQPHTMYL